MSKLSWKVKSLARGIDPDAALAELERIEAESGGLTARVVLRAAEPETSILHPLFTWDNDKAARLYRLREAKVLLNNIQMTVLSNGEERTISVYEVVKVPEGGRLYKNVSSFGTHEIQQIKIQTIRAINSHKQKLAMYNGFETAVEKLGDVLEELEA
jgi:hypothetical protein